MTDSESPKKPIREHTNTTNTNNRNIPTTSESKTEEDPDTTPTPPITRTTTKLQLIMSSSPKKLHETAPISEDTAGKILELGCKLHKEKIVQEIPNLHKAMQILSNLNYPFQNHVAKSEIQMEKPFAMDNECIFHQ